MVSIQQASPKPTVIPRWAMTVSVLCARKAPRHLQHGRHRLQQPRWRCRGMGSPLLSCREVLKVSREKTIVLSEVYWVYFRILFNVFSLVIQHAMILWICCALVPKHYQLHLQLPPGGLKIAMMEISGATCVLMGPFCRPLLFAMSSWTALVRNKSVLSLDVCIGLVGIPEYIIFSACISGYLSTFTWEYVDPFVLHKSACPTVRLELIASGAAYTILRMWLDFSHTLYMGLSINDTRWK